MSKRATAVQASKQSTPIKIVGADGLAGRTQELFDLIARRAFEIFESKGNTHGSDLEDWFRAESELLVPFRLGIADGDGAVIVRAKLQGFTAKDLEIGIEPRRLTIAGQREVKDGGSTTAPSAESGAKRILRIVDLPVEVNAERITATLQDDVLQVEMRKAVPTLESIPEPKTAPAVQSQY